MAWLKYITDTSRNKHRVTIHKKYKWIHSKVTITSTVLCFHNPNSTIEKWIVEILFLEVFGNQFLAFHNPEMQITKVRIFSSTNAHIFTTHNSQCGLHIVEIIFKIKLYIFVSVFYNADCKNWKSHFLHIFLFFTVPQTATCNANCGKQQLNKM